MQTPLHTLLKKISFHHPVVKAVEIISCLPLTFTLGNDQNYYYCKKKKVPTEIVKFITLFLKGA